MTDTGVPDGPGSTDDPGPDDETAELPKTASGAATLRVTKGTGHPGWMGRPVHPRLPIRRSTLLLVVLLAGFEFLHVAYPSQPPGTVTKTPTPPAGYVPAFVPASSTTTTSPTTTLPVTSTTTTTTVPGPKASSTTSTVKAGPTTTGAGSTSSTTSTLLPGIGGGTTTTTTTTFPS